MNRFPSLILAAVTLFAFTQCDDSTGEIGGSIIPEKDIIHAETDTCYADSKTIMANDSILANTSNVYLGQYSDEESGTIFNSSYITQLGCGEDFIFPEEGVIGNCAVYTKLRLYIDKHFGDSLNAMQCEVYELDNTLVEGKPYYTNLSPEDFYDTNKEPLAVKTFSAIDFTQPDSIINGNYTRHIEITLPNSIGNRFIEKFYEKDAEGKNTGSKYFANSEVFINEVFKGIYIKCTHGDGTILKIYRTRLDVGFQRYIKSSSGNLDSIQTLSAPFYSGKEVLQANKFDNTGLQALADEKGHTYIKTPAGLFTEITLPIEDAIENNNDINTAKIEFTRYNSNSTPPTMLLMVRKSDIHKFFLKNELANGTTSYLSSLTSSNNKYTFSNIANLLRHCYEEMTEGIKKDPEWVTKHSDWDKVVLIPVAVTRDSNGNVVKITHNTDHTSVKLRGGDSYRIPIEIISTKFNN